MCRFGARRSRRLRLPDAFAGGARASQFCKQSHRSQGHEQSHFELAHQAQRYDRTEAHSSYSSGALHRVPGAKHCSYCSSVFEAFSQLLVLAIAAVAAAADAIAAADLGPASTWHRDQLRIVDATGRVIRPNIVDLAEAPSAAPESKPVDRLTTRQADRLQLLAASSRCY